MLNEHTEVTHTGLAHGVTVEECQFSVVLETVGLLHGFHVLEVKLHVGFSLILLASSLIGRQERV